MTTKAQQNFDHVDDIREYIEVICQTDDIHALIVEGAAGWGKTSAVETALKMIERRSIHLGAYSTALNLYNSLDAYADRIVLLDDCAGLFNDTTSMAILKAATWPSKNNRRVVKWGSTSIKVTNPEFEFRGKLIIVCNHFPNTPDGDAIRSRAYVRELNITVDAAKKMLLQGAQVKKYFPNTVLASEVAEFLIERLNKSTFPQISFRTLKKGYHLAEYHPQSWKRLFLNTLPIKNNNVKPEEIVKELAKRNLKVKEQAKLFMEKTGLQERTFFNYRKELKINWKSNRRTENELQ